MVADKIICLNCSKKVPIHESYVDRIGQFTKLNVKAMQMGRKDVELCFECFDELTEGSWKSGRNYGRGFVSE